MKIHNYLIFDGNCREAATFYAQCLGAEVQIMPFSDAPGNTPPETKDRVMHARISKGGDTLLMASDTMPGHAFQQGNNYSVSLQCESVEQIDRLFAAIAEGGAIKMPLGDAFWGARFGMLIDRFGIHWMFNYEYPKSK